MKLDTSIVKNYRITIQNNVYHANEYNLNSYYNLRMEDIARVTEEINRRTSIDREWYGDRIYGQITHPEYTTVNNYTVCNDFASLYANTVVVNPTYYGTFPTSLY